MSGFDDRRDPTTPGRPAGPPTPRQQPYPPLRSVPASADGNDARPPHSGAHPGGTDDSGRPAGTPWQRGARSPGLIPGQPHSGPAEHGATPQWWQPDPATQWQPYQEPAPTPQWQPGGQSDPAPARPQGTQDDPTLLAPSSGGPAQPGPSGHNDPTMQAPSLGQTPSGQWPPQGGPGPGTGGRNDPTMLGQPLGALDPFGRGGPGPAPGSGDSAPTLLGYPSADRFGQPAPAPQWQPGGGPGQYGTAPDGRYHPGYGPQAGGPPPNRPSGSGRGKVLLSVGLAVLLVAGLAAGAVALTRMKTNDPAEGTAPSMVNALNTTTASAPARTTTRSAPTTTARGSGDKTPVVPGYQVVRAPDSGAAYDVPADWTVAPQGTIGGFGEPPNAVAGKGLASEGKGYCPGSTRTVAFLTGSNTSDPGKAATELGTRTATLAYTGTQGGTPGLPMPLASLDGSQHGMFVETKGTVSDAKPGCAKAYSVYTAAFPNDQGNFVMVIAADTGVPHALDAETAKKIFTSIRPLAG
ncbi:hypothetical protein ABZW96_28385 [Nocardia sp. NPDC004168]|uniref:hypothetical protein n=1 Tax=Nocardia sp. NPDC004168 TaxID=3154452 RepID=UPI0033B60C14